MRNLGYIMFGALLVVLLVMVGFQLYEDHKEMEQNLKEYSSKTEARFEEEKQNREQLSLTVNEKLNTTDAHVVGKENGKFEVLAGGDLYIVIHNPQTGEVSIFLESAAVEQP